MDFKSRLKELRIYKGLTQTELANALGVATSTISMYEQGKREPSLEMLDFLCDFFNVDTDYMLGKTYKTTMFPDFVSATSLSYDDKRILKPYNRLSTDGKNKVVEYAYDLLGTSKYDNSRPTRQEMIYWFADNDIRIAGLDGKTLSDDELYALYTEMKGQKKNDEL